MKAENICCTGAAYLGGPTMVVIAQKCSYLKVYVVDQNPGRIAASNIKDLN
jgi:UDPglucose 6-dehydrogenase